MWRKLMLDPTKDGEIPFRDKATLPQVTSEVFTIPLSDNQYVLYAPLRRSAFVGNAAIVNFVADLQAGTYDRSSDIDGSLVEFLRQLEFLDAPPETLPIRTYNGEPCPTTLIVQEFPFIASFLTLTSMNYYIS
jgi:hypothetical protein